MEKLPIRLFAACLFVLVVASTSLAQNFGPKGYPDCVMLFAKKAASQDGAMLTRLACKCRYHVDVRPECGKYSSQALDCMIQNLGRAEHNDEAWGVERLCRTKFPAK